MNKRIYVGNLAYATTSEQLNDLFSAHGEVKEVNLITDRDSGRSKGFAFVEMTSEDDVKAAIEALHDQDLDGRTIVVNEAKERVSRPARGGYDNRR
jgi:RNA recognition motif-containing protein